MFEKILRILAIAIAVFSFCLTPSPAIAQPIQCNPAGNTAEMKVCATENYQAADRQLNQVYQSLISQLSGEQKTRLIDAQRSWIDFRDKTCRFEAAEASGGTLEGLLLTQCLARVTAERSANLQAYASAPRDRPLHTAQPNPTSPAIASLTDGNYRYATAQLPSSVVTDDELAEAGGFYFLFRKKGNKVIGNYAEIDSENVICIDGEINGNTVSGQAVEYSEPPYKRATVINAGENFATWDKAAALKVRRGKDLGNKVQYSSALLDLSRFKRYNAGPQLPPTSCQ